MAGFEDDILRRAIKTLSEDLFPETLEKLRKKAHDEHLTLQQQLDMVTEEAMRGYVEPESLRDRKEPEKTVPTPPVRDWKMAATGEKGSEI
jgi:hypothetical protein